MDIDYFPPVGLCAWEQSQEILIYWCRGNHSSLWKSALSGLQQVPLYLTRLRRTKAHCRRRSQVSLLMEYLDPAEGGRNNAEEASATSKLFHPSLTKLYTALWARLEADSCCENSSLTGMDLWRSPVQCPAQSKAISKVRPRYSGLYPAGSWKPPSTETAQPQPAPTFGSPNSEKHFHCIPLETVVSSYVCCPSSS